jgi:hypothetical protein
MRAVLALVVAIGCAGTGGSTCDELSCEGTLMCVEDGNGARCGCGPGWREAGDGCADVDECAEGSPCDEHATCTNGAGSYTCTCQGGWEGTGESCVDRDECAGGVANCDPVASCTNVPGAFTCACPAGYDGDGFSCADVDECATGVCSASSTCVNEPGGYDCACNMGWTGDGTVCTVSYDFPASGDDRDIDSGSNFWHAGDNVEGTRPIGLGATTMATIHLEIIDNILSCDTQDMELRINGITVGSFSVMGGQTAVDATFTYPAIPVDGTVTLRYHTTATVAGGCGSAGIPDMGSTVVLQ